MNDPPDRTEHLTRLYDSVLQALPPKPGRRCDGLLVATVWVSETDPREVDMDFIGTPPDKMVPIVRAIVAMAKETGMAT